ncbi:hypothetical protein CaO19.6384 [Kluyveromyces marxianus]|nr:hypothetical protein CaO19.6384 [Kluyveromyces marxianus]
MDNTGTWLPETHVVLSGSSSQEVVNFLVDVNGSLQILFTTKLSLDQMVTVDSNWSGDFWQTSRHELQNSHLSSGILTSNTVWSQFQVGNTSLNFLAMWIVQMTV